MKEDIYNYLDKFEEQTKKRFWELYKVIYESTSRNIDEKLWAKLPSFYVNDKFKLPDTLIYSLVIILGIAFIIWDYKTFKNKTTRYMANIKSTSTFRETNSQIVITTRIDKAP